MKRFLGWLDRRWYLFLAGGCIGAELLVFLIFRENSYFTVPVSYTHLTLPTT